MVEVPLSVLLAFTALSGFMAGLIVVAMFAPRQQPDFEVDLADIQGYWIKGNGKGIPDWKEPPVA